MKKYNLLSLILLMVCVFGTRIVHAQGVEDLLIDFSDYLSTRLIPAAGAVGVAFGGIMAGFGSPQGVEIVKFSVLGAVVGSAGAQTLSMLFF